MKIVSMVALDEARRVKTCNRGRQGWAVAVSDLATVENTLGLVMKRRAGSIEKVDRWMSE